jgi:hypothetical protein
MKRTIKILFLLVVFSSCKPERFYTGDPEPVISKITLNQTSFKQFTDTVVIAFDTTWNPPPVPVVQLADGGGPSLALLKLSKTDVVGNAEYTVGRKFSIPEGSI